MSISYIEYQCSHEGCTLAWSRQDLEDGKPPRHNINGDESKEICPGSDLVVRKVLIEESK